MRYEFPMIPAASGSLWFFAILAVIILAILPLFGYMAYSSRHTEFVVSPDGLDIRGTFYGRMIPASSLVVGEARAIDLTIERDFRPRWRTNGIGMPGYQAGWFRLRNRGKALLFVTDRRHVVYLPTRDGYSVFLSIRDPDAFLRVLKETAGAL